MNLLDEIIIVPAPLAPLTPITAQQHTGFHVGGGHQAGSLLHTGDKDFSRPMPISPWLVGQISPAEVGANWTTLCTQASQRGLLLECSVTALEKLPVTSIPRRLFRQSVGMALNLEELHSADVVEITCQDVATRLWGWPPEVNSTESMGQWFSAVRHVVGMKTPFGLGVHSGIDGMTIQAIMDWPLDFITLYADGSMELLVQSICGIRSRMKVMGLQIPIMVRTSSQRLDHLVKILSLGASGVTVDGYLAELWKQSSASPASIFLGTKLTSATNAGPCPVAAHFDKLEATLISALQTTRCCSTAELVTWLRALSPLAARLARIPLISDDADSATGGFIS